MPELPEVETVVRGLAPNLTGAVAQHCWSDWPRVLDGLEPGEFNERIAGQTITGLHRRGKYICLTLSRDYLVVHLRMTGRLYISQSERGDDKWVHFSLALADGRHLVFSDARKFGRVTLCQSLEYLEEKLGPEPLEITEKEIADLIRNSNQAVKTFLLNQKNIAGVGNIYADESLFRAGIHPAEPVNQLSQPQTKRLAGAIRDVLAKAIDYEGASISWYRKADGSQGESQKHFLVYGRDNDPCYTCGQVILKTVLGQRGTHFCPSCQKPGGTSRGRRPGKAAS